MMESVEDRLNVVDSLGLVDQFEMLLGISADVIGILHASRGGEGLVLAQEAMGKIHGLRYRMAYNKATDVGSYDTRLEGAWESLRRSVAEYGG